MSIWQELSRRKVLRVAAAYIVIAWVLMQVASLLEETLELPNWFDKFAFAILLLGFPVALILSWAYDIRPDSQGQTSGSTGKFSIVAIILILVAGSVGLTTYVFRQTAATNISEVTPSIAVLPFADMSPGGDQAWFAARLARRRNDFDSIVG